MESTIHILQIKDVVLMLLTGLISVFMLYLNTRLSNLKEQITQMTNKVDKIESDLRERINKVEEENSGIKNNYLKRFDELQELITELKINLEKQISYCEIIHSNSNITKSKRRVK